jgi:hypothetical protein
MKNKDIKESKKLWNELCESVSKRPSPLDGMTEEEGIKYMRDIRKKVWEKKLATRP